VSRLYAQDLVLCLLALEQNHFITFVREPRTLVPLLKSLVRWDPHQSFSVAPQGPSSSDFSVLIYSHRGQLGSSELPLIKKLMAQPHKETQKGAGADLEDLIHDAVSTIEVTNKVSFLPRIPRHA